MQFIKCTMTNKCSKEACSHAPSCPASLAMLSSFNMQQPRQRLFRSSLLSRKALTTSSKGRVSKAKLLTSRLGPTWQGITTWHVATRAAEPPCHVENQQ